LWFKVDGNVILFTMALLQHLRIALQVRKQKFKFKWPSISKKRPSLLTILDKKKRKSSHLLQ
jgi:hypothetical protein